MKARPPGFPQFTLRRLARTTSTQDVVRAAARGGAPEGFCCVADEQTAGRGRQGRAWVAPPGSSLLTSLLVRRAPAESPGIPLAAGLAMVEAIRTAAHIETRLKWPNDVVVAGRKLAGFLAEVESRASTHDRLAVVVGFGLNLRVTDFPAGVGGVSLHELTAQLPPPDDLLAAWLDSFAQRLDVLATAGIGGIREEWRRSAAGLGEAVRADTPGGVVSGVAEDIDSDGALLVRTSSGVTRLVAGDVHLTPRA